MDVFKELTFTNSFWAFFIPSMMMLADIVTGLIYSWVKKKFKSSVMRQGLGKKVGELTVIALVNLICCTVEDLINNWNLDPKFLQILADTHAFHEHNIP